jgi:hypothetical protein
MIGGAAETKALVIDDTKRWKDYARLAKIEPV